MMQHGTQARTSVNGFGRKRVEKEMGSRVDNKLQSGKTNISGLTNSGSSSGSKSGSLSRDRLVYFATCLIGQQVEVQVADGSVFSGLFYAANLEKDFGVILTMARRIKSGSSRGKKNIPESVNNPPTKFLIIPEKELVQIIKKDLLNPADWFANELQIEKQQEIMIDSKISQSRYVETERELERWVPDDDNPECPELENIFDGHWNRGWDQFQANETLFGVKSTFDEELYTTKLDRGPQMKDLEKEALRIAREIEGEDTQDLHLAEERGIHFHDKFDIDEETRYSSVFRGVDDSGYDETEDISDLLNSQTFGDASDSVLQPFAVLNSGDSNDEAQVSSSFSPLDEGLSSQSSFGRDLTLPTSGDYTSQLSSASLPANTSALGGEKRGQEHLFNEQHPGSNKNVEDIEKRMLSEENQTLKSIDSKSSQRSIKECSDKGALSPDATEYAPSHVSSKALEKTITSTHVSDSAASVKIQGASQPVSRTRPGSSASSKSDCGNAASASSGPGISPSSSLNSLSSEKSSLNPNAKEFRLNPNAKSFVPSQTPIRPASPVSDGSFYYPANVAAFSHIPGMPVGIGVGPSFVHPQQVMFSQHATPMQTQAAYFHSNGQYGQQMLLGQPRQVMYMPTYPSEMRREF